MSEKRILIKSTDLKIEALVDLSEGHKAVVVTHPHPLYGADMHNSVVRSVVQAYCRMGYSTLRLNFRGVGESEGQYDQGIGEQEDVRAAIRHFSDLGKTAIDLAGYSFGAWVNALGLDDFAQVSRMIMVSPPVSFIDFSFFSGNSKVKLVIAGSEDDIAPPSVIEGMLPRWNPHAIFKVIKGADHFYGEKTAELETIIQDFLALET
jgi:alpha/beta superfamily hydrolase